MFFPASKYSDINIRTFICFCNKFNLFIISAKLRNAQEKINKQGKKYYAVINLKVLYLVVDSASDCII